MRNTQLGQEQQRIGLQQQAQPSEIAQREAQTANVQAQTAAGLPAAQAAAEQARAEQTRLQTAYEKETNPIQKASLESQLKLNQISVQRAESALQFFGAAATGAHNTPSGFDQMMDSTRTTLGKLSPDEKAQLDAAEQSARFDAFNGKPDALNHVQQAVNDISNNRRALEVARMYGSIRGDLYNKDYLNTDTNSLEQLTAGEFAAASKNSPGRYVEFSPTVSNSLKAQGQVNDIYDGIKNMRSVLNDPKFQFTAQGRTLMAAAQRDPTVLTAALSGEAAKSLSPQERNYFVAVQTLVERGMSLRGLQGQGAGSDAQREAIVRLLPGLLDADPAMAKQKVDQFQNNVDNLNKMIPKIGKQSKTSATEAAQPKVLNFDAQGNLIQGQ